MNLPRPKMFEAIDSVLLLLDEPPRFAFGGYG
jgi:hypothetical protein